MQKLFLTVTALLLLLSLSFPDMSYAQNMFQSPQESENLKSGIETNVNEGTGIEQGTGTEAVTSQTQAFAGPGILWLLLLMAGVAIAYLLIRGEGEENADADININDIAYGYKGGKTRREHIKQKPH